MLNINSAFFTPFPGWTNLWAWGMYSDGFEWEGQRVSLACSNHISGGLQKMTRRGHRGRWSAGRKALHRNYLARLLGDSEGEAPVLVGSSWLNLHSSHLLSGLGLSGFWGAIDYREHPDVRETPAVECHSGRCGAAAGSSMLAPRVQPKFCRWG